MEDIAVETCRWRGMPAWRVRGSALSIVLTETGGHLASLTARGDDLDPFWQPQWPAADPATVEPGGFYGGVEAKLLATIVGHNLCLHRFGAPWPGEPVPLHGEVAVVRWDLRYGDDSCELSARLPEARLLVRRAFRFEGPRIELTTSLRHDGEGSREAEWAEHINVGDPFLDGVDFAAGIDRATSWPAAPEPGARFGGPEADVPPTAALVFPAVDAPPLGDVLCGRVAEGWWSATNRRLGRRLSYRWDASEFPWLVLWTQHRSREANPWRGRERVRGMEVSTKPWPEGKPPASRAERYQDRPTTCMVPADRDLVRRMTIAWERA